MLFIKKEKRLAKGKKSLCLRNKAAQRGKIENAAQRRDTEGHTPGGRGCKFAEKRREETSRHTSVLSERSITALPFQPREPEGFKADGKAAGYENKNDKH